MSDDYEIIEKIGEGMYGKVYKAINIKENKYYAIKRLNFKDIGEKEKKQINNEVSLIRQLKHPNVISYKESFNDKDNNFNIVTIFCEGGDMYNKIQKQNDEYFNEDQIINWMIQILLGLNYIHKNGIIHRDIKPQNIYIQNKHIICIGDFGIAKIANQIQTQTMTSIIGTPLYMSPESFSEPKSKNFASDIWSTGCCLFEICNLKHAFGADRWESVYYKVREGIHAPVNKKYSTELRNIIESMLNVNPSKRPTIPQLFKNYFLRPKIANYINDFIKNYKIYDSNEEQVQILKKQAEEFGLFKNKISVKIRESSIEKDDKTKKNSYKKFYGHSHERRGSSNPMSPEKENTKKYSLEKNKRNKMYDYDNSLNKKMKNKNKEYNISSTKKSKNNGGDYTSDDNKKKHNNKDKICNKINNYISSNIKRAGRPLTAQKVVKTIQADQEYNISIIKKKVKNNSKDHNNYNQYKNDKKKFDSISRDNMQLQNKINLNINRINNENKNDSNNNDNTKEKLLNEKINIFKNKCIKGLKEEIYLRAYDYLLTTKKNKNEINNTEIRENLIKKQKKKNIGYWHLIEQIILFEEMLNDR